MSLNVAKGGNLNLDKAAAEAGVALTILAVACGWDFKNNKRIDLDLAAIPFGQDGKSISDKTCFYGRTSVGDYIKHTGDNRTGAGDGDDETINIDLTKVPADIKGFSIVVFSYSGENFGQVSNAFCRAYDASSPTKTEFVKYDMSEDLANEKHVVLGRVYKHNEEWKFKAIGEGSPENRLQQIADSIQV